MLAAAGEVGAEGAIGSYGAVAESYDSNVLQLASRDEAVTQNGDAQRDDMISEQLIGLKSIYDWGLQRFDLAAEGRRYEFAHFDALNHNEYLLAGGLDWKLADRLSGRVSYKQDSQMAMFANLGTTSLTLQREKTADSDTVYHFLPEWSLEGDAQYHESSLPLPGSPQFKLNDTSGLATLRYLGISTLAMGVSIGYSGGKYSGVANASSFKQSTLNFVADYAISDLSSAQLQAGYSKRQEGESSNQDVSGFTGTLGFRRKISVKTSVDAQLSRAINSYIAGSSSEVDQGVTAHASYLPTAKLGVDLSYQWLYSSFRGASTDGLPTEGRQDHYQITELKLVYTPIYWLDADVFARYQDRHSDVLINGFNDSAVGLELRAHFGRNPAVQTEPAAGGGAMLF